ncbi:MAG TPA: SURF1 family protein, partial [Azonexus sp.]
MDESPADFPALQYARRPAAAASRNRRTGLIFGGLLQLLLVPAFVSLGLWQWDKAEQKTAQQATLDSRSRQPAVAMPTAPAEAATLRHHRVLLRGRYDAARQVLIDNRLYREQAGYHVITPL